MKLRVKKEGDKLVPADQESLDMVKTLPKDEVYTVTIKLCRNYKLLQKYMVLIKLGHDNTRKIKGSKEEYRDIMQIRAGYFTSCLTDIGTYVKAKSVAFDSMPEEEFQELYSRVLDQIILDLGADREFIENELLTFM